MTQPIDLPELPAARNVYEVQAAHRDGARCPDCLPGQSRWYCPTYMAWWPVIAGGALSG